MHIPDGYLSPKTCLFFYAAMLPVWYVASRKVEGTLKLKELPLLSLGAAFAFVIMMFNIPLPGGTSGHMAGAVIVAIVLGPWASVVALTVVLTLQALLFGDGGLTTLGANAFNIAFVMSFAGHYVYTAICCVGGKSTPVSASRRAVGAAVAAYVAVNLSALFAAFTLGLQPVLAGSGVALYAPYGLGVTLPAMALPHLLFVAPVEAFGTAVVVAYLYRNGLVMPGANAAAAPRLRPLWFGLAVLILLVPFGLIATAAPWGEWNGKEVVGLIGYLPAGIERMGELWVGLMPDYTLPVVGISAGYVITAIVGSICAVLSIYLFERLLRFGRFVFFGVRGVRGAR